MRIAILLIAAFAIFSLGLKVTGDSPVSRKIPFENTGKSAEEKWNKAKEWSKSKLK